MQEAYHPPRGKHMLCYPRWGGYLLWWGGTYHGGGVPTLVGGTYSGGGVPTLGGGGTYLGRG